MISPSAPDFSNLNDNPLGVHEEFNSLPENEVNKIIFLIEVLKQIDRINTPSRTTPNLLNGTIHYLEDRLKIAKERGNPQTFLQENSAEFIEVLFKFPQWVLKGHKFHSAIDPLSLNRKRELIALGHFLQGKMKTEKEFNYIINVLESYLEAIKQFRMH